MSYVYLEDIATADIAFRATGKTLEEMFRSSADAVMNVMVEDIASVEGVDHQTVLIEDESIELVLFQFLQEFIFFKDARNLLLRVDTLHLEEKGQGYVCSADLKGETLNPAKHQLNVDIKAVTFHRFEVKETPGGGWESTVVLDI